MSGQFEVNDTLDPPGVEPSEPPIEAGRSLAQLVIQKMVVPLIVSGLVDLDEAIELIKRGVVTSLAETGESNVFLADHVAKSRSWFQSYLRKVKEDEQRVRVDPNQPGGSQGGLDDTGHRFMSQVLLSLSVVYPEGVGIDELRKFTEEPAWRVSDEEFARRLHFYARLGVVNILGYDRRGPVVQAAEKIPRVSPKPEHVEWLGIRLGWIVPLAIAYCEGRGEFGGIVAELSSAALKKARRRLKEAAADIIADAVAETHKTDEPVESDLSVRAIIAIGASGGFDD